MKIKTINLNDQVVIYPTSKGWEKIRDLLLESGYLDEVDKKIQSHKTPEGGCKDQFWCIINELGSIWFNGTRYASSNVEIIEPVKEMERSDIIDKL